MKYTFLTGLLLMLFLVSCSNKDFHSFESYENYVLIVSLDAFRWDYPDLYDTPNLDAMEEQGVKAESLISSFPTKTFPNHYTMATGLYPDHHGLINNTFFAPDLDMEYRIGNKIVLRNPEFYGGEPIWVTAEKQGVISATFYWVGSEAPIGGIEPRYWKAYDERVPFAARIDTVISWLELPLEKRPRFVMLYFHEPDEVGHDYGPAHNKTRKTVEELDGLMGKLRKKIAKLPYGDKVNLIITSDHGMGAISPERYVNIFDHVDPAWILDIYGGNPVYLMDADDEYADSVANLLDAAEGITAWTKEDIPGHLNYGKHTRISDIVVVADSSWSVGTTNELSAYTGGAHGYDNSNRDMDAIFYADGPDFKDGWQHPSFENVNLYVLIAKILGLKAAETDGELEEVAGMLK